MYHCERNKIAELLHYKLDIYQVLADNNAFLAGGALTSIFTNSDIINDLDIFFETKENYDQTNKIITPYTISSMNGPKIQFIEKVLGTPYQIFETFDFTCCMAAFSFKTGTFIFHPHFFKHLSQKKLVINIKTKSPLSTLIRIKKYIDKGFTIDNVNFLLLGLLISRLKIETYKQLKEQLGSFYISTFFNSDDKYFELDDIISNLIDHFDILGKKLQKDDNKYDIFQV